MPLKQNKFKYIDTRDVVLLPQTTGIYCFKRGVDFLYIGKALNIKERIKNHIQQPTFKDTIFIPETEKIGFIATGSEIEALIFEANLIKKYQPKYNQQWKDGKNYYFVAITKEQWPRVFITHQTELQESGIKNQELRQKTSPNSLFPIPNSKFIGPFIDGNSLKQTLRILRKIFPFRTCNKLPKKACLYKDLNLCPAPCQKKCVNPCRSTNFDTKKSYAKNIKNLMAILNGKKNSVIKNLQKEMAQASQQQNFEKAKELRDQIFALENVFSHSHVLKETEGVKLLANPKCKEFNSLQELQKLLGLKTKIKRIEGYDVSNIQGQQATGSMVVFESGKPNKNEYRKFKIKITGKPNDTAMLKEVISRRLKHKEWPMPQVMLIDGGKGQLNAILKIKNQKLKIKNANQKLKIEEIKVISLAKRKNELFVENQEKPVLLKNLSQETANLILQIRDEAHRFAITYHKTLRSKNFIK
ncbi:MAG: UvrB/UvrC motif-containing protein [Candidatus Pacebacteria bacterium]|nr:UvrB/UvrC motif-containing protein [Candidatus Paceibacterota bacterium]